MSLAMSLSGNVFGFTKGWSFSLIIMTLFPVIAITSAFTTKVTQKGFKENIKAYG